MGHVLRPDFEAPALDVRKYWLAALQAVNYKIQFSSSIVFSRTTIRDLTHKKNYSSSVDTPHELTGMYNILFHSFISLTVLLC